MAAEKRAEHEPGDQNIVTDAIKYVGPVRNQLAVDPHPQHAVMPATAIPCRLKRYQPVRRNNQSEKNPPRMPPNMAAALTWVV